MYLQTEQRKKVHHPKLLTSKRPVLLLEVMIAIALIVMVAIPLIYPHIYLLKAQRHFMDKVELDHVVNLLYVDAVERLYMNTFTWTSILNKLEYEIDASDLKKIGYDKPVPFKGKYRFAVDTYKPKGKESSSFTLYLLTLDYEFSPAKESVTEFNQLKYHYVLFVVRDLGEGELPQGDESDFEDEGDNP